jgi:hypothetical protein
MRVHMVLKNDPEMAQQMQNSPSGGAINGALDAHVREHLAFIFRRQVEEEFGVPLPPANERLPENVERRLSALIADAADQMMGKKQQKAQAEKAAQQQQDPIIQQRERELAIQEQDAQRKQQADAAKQQLDQQKLELERDKLESKERHETAELALDEQELIIKAQADQQKVDLETQLEGFKLGRDLGKDADEGDRKDKETKGG